jgi:hypothetical protein
LKSGFSQFGAAPKCDDSPSVPVESVYAPPPHSEMLERGQSGFAITKWDNANTPRDCRLSLCDSSATFAERKATAQDQPGPAPQLPGDRVAWQGAFRTVPVPKADPAVVQTAGQLTAEPVRAAMLPMPASPSLNNEDNRKQSPGLQKIEVPVTPPGSVIIGDSDAAPPTEVDGCKSARDLKSIRNITADISVKPSDLTGAKHLPPECSLGKEKLEPRHWERTTFSWVAASTYHKPIYFDDDQLERYGHTFGPVTQTTLSAVKFFATVPLVPYYMGVYPPNECIYDLGLYRPGSCSPYYCDPFPLSVRGAINEMSLGIFPAL